MLSLGNYVESEVFDERTGASGIRRDSWATVGANRKKSKQEWRTYTLLRNIGARPTRERV